MSNTEINMNFDDENRNLKYPKLEDIQSADNDLIMELINGLPSPKSREQLNIFNVIWNEFYLRGGKV